MSDRMGYHTIHEVKGDADRHGNAWFAKETMRWHRTRLTNVFYPTPQGAVFVTSDGAGFREEDGRGYTVRETTKEPFRVGTAEGHEVAEYGDLQIARHFALLLMNKRKDQAEG